MKLVIEIDENEIMEEAKRIVAETIAKKMLGEFRSSEKYCYHKVIKECVREAIKEDKDNLSDRAVQAASVSIVNKCLKKASAEELLARIAGRNGE